MDHAADVIMKSAQKNKLIDPNDFGFVPELEAQLLEMADSAIEVVGAASSGAGLSNQHVGKAFLYVYAKALEAVIQWAEDPAGRTDVEFTATDLLQMTPRCKLLSPEQVGKIGEALRDAKTLFIDLSAWTAEHLACFADGRLDVVDEMRMAIYTGGKVAVANAMLTRKFFKDITGNCLEAKGPYANLWQSLLAKFRR